MQYIEEKIIKITKPKRNDNGKYFIRKWQLYLNINNWKSIAVFKSNILSIKCSKLLGNYFNQTFFIKQLTLWLKTLCHRWCLGVNFAVSWLNFSKYISISSIQLLVNKTLTN